ncbi:hypothetical protein IQ13_2314 [Lacibacter cauensis]|uniref:Uncharacterized protein n=1 Tax=Lacibacter cauensis TaxID=510947 RepID=A0A562SJ56_9BACT|nr:hypothetical protein [Lacibacter cauensis]TWI81297.1 hypothetical protein IQ13_2314 [Lacibacter cauensis]
MRKYALLILFQIYGTVVLMAQTQNRITFDTSKVEIPMSRVIWHENIDKEQKRTDKVDGKVDNFLKLTSNEDLNIQITDVILREVDEMQIRIEKGEGDNNFKIGQLRSLRELLQAIAGRAKEKEIPPMIPLLFTSYEEVMKRQGSGQSVLSVFEKLPYQGTEILSGIFTQLKEAQQIKNMAFLKKVQTNPSNILSGIAAFADQPFADSLIEVAADKIPLEVYTYAQAIKTPAAQVIRRNKNPKVQTIAKLSSIMNGTLYLPFLDELLNNQLAIDDIKAVVENELAYYKLIVKTQIKYYNRISQGDTPVLAPVLFQMLERKATDVFVNVMNDLHDSPDAVRMRVSDPLTSEEIYYLLVTTEEVIYTSTYTKLYDRMMTRFPGRRSDSLLMSVHFDKFKKFIKMAANYNRLDDFLKSMPEIRSNQLMYAFVQGLQKTSSLEDAVDVADSYGSITNVDLQNFLKLQVKENYEKSLQVKDRRGEVIYNILLTLFKSAADTSMNLSALLGIPPVYKVDYNSITDDSGRVVQHVFFYGDEDGVTSFRNFMGMFNGKPEWKVVTGKEWVTITSTKGKPYTIYANLPLDYKQDLDAQAQAHLIEYLNKNNINPSFVVHRGHSYHLKYTLQQMLPSSRIVMLGSCGGYQNLAKILNVNEDAHIISTKQVGSYSVNEPILRALNEDIRNGRNIEWIPLWQQIANSVKSDGRASELLKDYVPPHKNLGAIFIKAYRKATGEM